MSRVFIGRRFNDPWLIVPAALVGLGFTLGVYHYATSRRPPDGPVFWVWAAVAAFAIARTVWIAADRRWAALTAGGLTILERSRDRFIPDDAVVAIGFWNRSHYERGTARHRLVTVELLMDDGRRRGRVRFAYRYGLDDHDPLWDWRAALIERLEGQAVRAIATGGSFATDHWELDRDGLSWTERGRRQHLPAEGLGHATTADGAFCVWRGDDERPAFRLKHGSLNAMVLWGVLARMMPERPAGEPRVADGLGRVLCDRSPEGAGRLPVLMLAAFTLIVGLVALAISVNRPDGRPDTPAFGWGAVGFALLLGLIVLFTGRTTVSFHTHGVSQKGLLGTRRLRFLDLASMWWTETRGYYQGVYTGTEVRVRLKGYDGTEVRFRMSVNNVDVDLNGLWQTAADHVARRLRGSVARGRRVRWVGRLTFTPDGLAVAPWLSWFGGRELVLPYWSLGWTFADGKLHLDCGGRRVTVDADVSAENFQPGMVLLDLLRTEPIPAGGYRT